MKYVPENIESLEANQVFVFGSNANGNHSGGAAKLALEKFGAIQGQAEGLMGQSYGFVTLNKRMNKVSLAVVKKQFLELFNYARENPDKEFLLTKVGCGIAGFNSKEIRDCFNTEDVPLNVKLPKEWIYRQLWKSLPKNMTRYDHKFKKGVWYDKPVNSDGEQAPISTCDCGYHASERIIDAISYVDCEVLARVEIRGTIDEENDKVASEEMRIIHTVKWTKVMSVQLAIFAAEQVIGIYEKEYPNDKRPREAIKAAKNWLKKPSAAASDAARAAAWAAAWAAARAAACDAARAASAAASDAARAAARAAAWAAARAASAAASDAARAATLNKIEDYILTVILKGWLTNFS